MKIFLVAGEASGDLHASHVVKALRAAKLPDNQDLELVGWGGDRMQAAGMRLLSHYKDRAFMGLVEVIKNIRTVMGFLSQAKEDILCEQPDMLLLIDNPGFNLRLAEFAKYRGIPVHYYIAPKAWAWNEGRIKTMRKCIDALYVIFPFEVAYFESRGMPCTYVGNPIFDEIDEVVERFHENRGWDVELDTLVESETMRDLEDSKIILLMPGSRRNEVSSLLPVFIQSARKYDTSARCLVAGAPGLTADFYQEVLLRAVEQKAISKADADSVQVVFGATYSMLMQLGDGALIAPIRRKTMGRGLALVASGTATLETALLGVPQVVAYRLNAISYWVARKLVKLKWVSLVNILLNRGLVVEHLQEVTPERLVWSMQQLDADYNPVNVGKVQAGYRELREQLKNSDGSSASVNLANLLLGVRKIERI
jgi:lipid-A-disaccharide synthase